MQRSRKFANPFYMLLLLAGVIFAVTATAYGVMAFREARPVGVQPDSPAAPINVARDEHPLMQWMRQHGEVALLTELAFLAVFTFAAIGTDDYWQRRDRRTVTSR